MNKKYACVLMITAVVLMGARCAGAAGGLIDALIRKCGWDGTGCLINILVFNVPCQAPSRPVCSAGCTRGKMQNNNDGTCTWKPDANGTKCGKNFEFQRQKPGDPTVIETIYTCMECASGKTAFLGFDALPPVTTTPNVASVMPPPGKLLNPKQSIVIKFKQTMDATSPVLSSDMAPEAGPYAFLRSTDQFLFNDTLTIPPLNAWQPGRRTLTADIKDDSGNPANVKASWFVLAPGQAAAPDFSTCTTGCGQRWFLEYGVVFTATGGFPPYTWSIQGIAPPHDEAVFASTGAFGKGPTNWYGEYHFTVCVTDQAQSQTCHPVRWESGL